MRLSDRKKGKEHLKIIPKQGHQIVQVKRKDRFNLKSLIRDFPGDLVIKTTCFHFREGEGSIPSPGIKITFATTTTGGKKKVRLSLILSLLELSLY